MSIFLPDFDIGRLASRRKCILGRKMLFAFACGCATRFMMFHARPLQKPKSEVQQTWLQQVRCALLWNTSNHICLTMNFVQWMLCSVYVSTKKGLSVWIEDSTVFVGGLNFDTTSEGRAMRPVCVPWTCFCTVQSNSNPAEQLPSELWTVYSERCTDLQWLMKFAETVFASGLQQHFAQVGEVIYAAIFTVRGTGKPRGWDQNESWQC